MENQLKQKSREFGENKVMRSTRHFDLRVKWIKQMGNTQIHSVWQQLWRMIYLDLNIRTINFITDLEPNCPLNNPMIKKIVREGHAPFQAISIRRLWSETRGDLSLKRILSEMKKNISFFTRENYLACSGLPYNTAPITDEELSRLSVPSLPGSSFVSPSSPSMLNIRIEQAHTQFDHLSKTIPENRKQSDSIPRRLFEVLERHVQNSGIEKIVDWSSQNVAHAGDPDHPYWEEIKATWDDIESSQRALAQVAQIISGIVLNGPTVVLLVPTPQYDRFEYLTNVLSQETLQKAYKHQSELENNRNSWIEGNILEVVGW